MSNRGMQIGSGKRIGRDERDDAAPTAALLARPKRSLRERIAGEQPYRIVRDLFLVTVAQARRDPDGHEEQAREFLRGGLGRTIEWYLGIPEGTGTRAVHQRKPRANNRQDADEGRVGE